ncbi:MAG TPA: AAA family ATPase, partial [Lacipirellulaceae bacterium]|nr:AAA family ATPase [Lacipirellulaceae bacterium]
MWHGIIGHDDVVEQFRRILMSGRLASTYLFVGPPGVGKRRFALELAHSLLCTEAPEASLQPCGNCESCRMFATGNHPDLELICLPPDRSTLPISLFVGDHDHRNQEGLCHRIGLRSFFGRRKVAIIDDADHFGIESANCLLKTLEEPPPSALLILIGTSPSRQLPTIRSRSQIVRFRALDAETVAQILLDTGAISDPTQARRAAELGDGSAERARALADPVLWQFRDQLLSALTAARPDSVRLGRAIQAFTDEAGKE